MSLDVKFSATDAGFTSTVSKVKQSVKSMDDSVGVAAGSVKSSFGDMAKAGAAIGLGFGALKLVGDAIAKTFGTFKDALDLGGTLADLADQTGETAGNLLILQRAFENSGLSADQVGTSINKIQKTLVAAAEGTDEAEKKFSKLGLTFSDLEGKSPTEQFKILADAISKLPTPAEKSAAAIEWFGKSGGKSLAFMQNFSGEIETAKGQLGSLPGVMDRSAKSFDDISDNLTVMKGKVLDFAAGFLENAAPALQKFTNLLSGVDAAGWGQKTMDMILKIADTFLGVFQSPMKYIELIGQALDLNARLFGDLLVNGVITMGDAMSKIFGSNIPNIILDLLLNSLIKVSIDATKSFLDYGLKAIDAFVNTFGSGIEGVTKFFSKSLSMVLDSASSDFALMFVNPVAFFVKKMGGALVTLANDSENSFKNSFNSSSGDFISKLSSGLGGVSDEYGNKLKAGTSNLKGEFSDVLKSIKVADGDIFDAKGSGAKLRVIAGELEASGRAFRENLTQGSSAMDDATKSVSTAGEEFGKLQSKIDPLDSSFQQIKSSSDNASGGIRELHRSIILLPSEKKVKVEVELNQDQQFKKDVEDLTNIINGVPNSKIVNLAIDAGGFKDLNDLKKQLDFFPDSKQVKLAISQTGYNLEELKEAVNGIPEKKRSEIALRVLGTADLEKAAKILGTLTDKKIQLLCKTYGVENVDELSNALRGVPDPDLVNLVAEVTGKNDIDSMNRALDTLSTKKKKYLVEVSGKKDIDDIRDSINGLSDKKLEKKALEISGLTDVEDLKDALDLLKTKMLGLNLDVETQDASNDIGNIKSQLDALDTQARLNINTEDADKSIKGVEYGMTGLFDSVRFGLNTTDADGQIGQIQTSIDDFGKDTKLNLNADYSIQAIRAAIQEPLDLDLNSKDTGSQSDKSSLENLVEAIKNAVERLETKLPMPALGY